MSSVKSKRRLSDEELREESRRVSLFAFSHLGNEVGSDIATKVVFEAFKRWLREHQSPPTALSVDGFGRLLPKTFERKVGRYKGKSCKVLKDVVVR